MTTLPYTEDVAARVYFKRAMLERYEVDALMALKRAATAQEENTRRYEVDQAIMHVRLAMGITGDDTA